MPSSPLFKVSPNSQDRLEIRCQTREQQKKRSVSMAEINEDLESDDVDLSGAAVTSPSKRPKVIDGDGDGELDIIGVASSNGNLLCRNGVSHFCF